MSHRNIINKIANQEDEDIIWKIKLIFAHEGTLIDSCNDCKGCWYNVLVEWYTGETTNSLSISLQKMILSNAPCMLMRNIKISYLVF